MPTSPKQVNLKVVPPHWFYFCLQGTAFPSLGNYQWCPGCSVDNAAQRRSDGDSDEGGVKENRTSRLQIDSAVFQFPHSAMAEPVKLSLEI